MLRVVVAGTLAGVVVAVAGLLSWRGNDHSSRIVAQPIGEAYSAALRELGPETVLHTKSVEYRRHGSLNDSMAGRADYRPETVYVEAWLEFDSAGRLASLRAETRGADGALYLVARSDGEDVIYEDGAAGELKRARGVLRDLTVASYKARVSEVYADAVAAVDNAPLGARRTSLNGQVVLVLESKKPFTGSVVNLQSRPGVTGYAVPYVGDLRRPVEEVTRQFMSEAEKRGLRYERAVVDDSGKETVIESSEQLLVEVLPR